MPREFSTKRIAIDKAYATLVIAISVAAFVTVFSLVASKALLDQRSYQSRVVEKKELAKTTLANNLVAADQLTAAYQEFVGATTNVIGGNPKGDADSDGDNARIVLDALPSKYDFPGLTTSLDKLLRGGSFVATSIEGKDDEVAQGSVASSEAPQPIEIPFSVDVTVNSKKRIELMRLFERSIRPIKVQILNISGSDSQLEFKIDAITYFQPEKNLNLKTEVVK